MLSNLKTIILLLFALVLLGPLHLKAQSQYTFEDGDFGIRFHVNGLINNINLTPANDPNGNVILSVRKFVKEDLAVSAGIGIQSFNRNVNRIDSLGTFRREFDSTSSEFNFYFTPGIEKYFFATERLTPYIGANLSIGALGRNARSSNTQLIDTTGTRRIEITDDAPGGFQFGVNFHMGFDYFVAKKLSLGANYRFGYLASRVGGDFNRVTIDTPITGSTNISRDIGSDVTRSRGFYFSQNVNLTLTYFFATK